VAAGVSPACQRGDARDHEHGIDDQRIQSRQGSVPRPPPGDLGTGYKSASVARTREPVDHQRSAAAWWPWDADPDP
jgi:hypothetical protein